MPTLLVMLKYPKPGRVKTRLAEAIGADAAAELYRQWIGLVLEKAQPIRDQASLIAYYAGAPYASFQPWHHLADQWWPQPEGDLGARLAFAFERATQPAIAIGTDCLDIDADLLPEAFDRLRDHEAVFGPATDGGYYLVGMSRWLHGFFDGVSWSSERTLASHLEMCDEHGWRAAHLAERRDIDTIDDWQIYCETT